MYHKYNEKFHLKITLHLLKAFWLAEKFWVANQNAKNECSVNLHTAFLQDQLLTSFVLNNLNVLFQVT